MSSQIKTLYLDNRLELNLRKNSFSSWIICHELQDRSHRKLLLGYEPHAILCSTQIKKHKKSIKLTTIFTTNPLLRFCIAMHFILLAFPEYGHVRASRTVSAFKVQRKTPYSIKKWKSAKFDVFNLLQNPQLEIMHYCSVIVPKESWPQHNLTTGLGDPQVRRDKRPPVCTSRIVLHKKVGDDNDGFITGWSEPVLFVLWVAGDDRLSC